MSRESAGHGALRPLSGRGAVVGAPGAAAGRPAAGANRPPPSARGPGPALALPLIVLAGLALRIAPCLHDPSFDLMFDARYHERLTREVVETGRLDPVDHLSEAPEGRRTARHLPVGLYYTYAAGHRVLSALGSRSLRWNLVLLVALAGALIAIPVWIGARAVFADRRAAAIAALLSVFLPAHLARTQGFAVRYDALGTLLATLHAALSLAALGEMRRRRRWTLAIGSALALVAAMSVWRVSLLVLEAELAAAAALFLARGAEPALRDLWLALALAGTAGLAPIGYLGEHHFLSSPLWYSVLGFAVVAALPGLRASRRWSLRLAALAVAVGLALGVGRLAFALDYAGVADMLRARLGLAPGHDPDAAMMLTVLELQGMSLARFLWGGQVFSVLGAVFVTSPLLFAWLARRPSAPGAFADALAPAGAAAPGETDGAARPRSAHVLLAFLGAAFTVATLFFQRGCVLVAPILSVVTGGLIVELWAAGRSGVPGARAAVGRGARRPIRAIAALALAAIASAGAVAAMVAGVSLAATARSRYSPNERAAIAYLRDHAAPGAVVMADWDAGYEIQAFSGLATATDGLLESAENRQRIIELYDALMDPAPAKLEALCRRCRARWVLVPSARAIYAMAVVTGDPVAALIARHEEVPRGPMTDHLILRLIDGDVTYPGLRRAVEAGGFTVFEVTDSTRSP